MLNMLSTHVMLNMLSINVTLNMSSIHVVLNMLSMDMMLNTLLVYVMLSACCQLFAWRQAYDNDDTAAQHHLSVHAADRAWASACHSFHQQCRWSSSLAKGNCFLHLLFILNQCSYHDCDRVDQIYSATSVCLSQSDCTHLPLLSFYLYGWA